MRRQISIQFILMRILRNLLLNTQVMILVLTGGIVVVSDLLLRLLFLALVFYVGHGLAPLMRIKLPYLL